MCYSLTLSSLFGSSRWCRCISIFHAHAGGSLAILFFLYLVTMRSLAYMGFLFFLLLDRESSGVSGSFRCEIRARLASVPFEFGMCSPRSCSVPAFRRAHIRSGARMCELCFFFACFVSSAGQIRIYNCYVVLFHDGLDFNQRSDSYYHRWARRAGPRRPRPRNTRAQDAG